MQFITCQSVFTVLVLPNTCTNTYAYKPIINDEDKYIRVKQLLSLKNCVFRITCDTDLFFCQRKSDGKTWLIPSISISTKTLCLSDVHKLNKYLVSDQRTFFIALQNFYENSKNYISRKAVENNKKKSCNGDTMFDCQAYAKKHGGLCLNDEDTIITARTNLKWQCAQGHQWERDWQIHYLDQWCAVCACVNIGIEKTSESKKRKQANKYRYVKEYITSEDAREDAKLQSAKRRKQNPDYMKQYNKKYYQTVHGSLTSCLANAKIKGKYKVNITVDNLLKLYKEQSARCKITGLPFHFLPDEKKKVRHPYSPSIDRIDSLKHYDLDNVQLVLKWVNLSKQQLSNQEYLNFIESSKYIDRKMPMIYNDIKVNDELSKKISKCLRGAHNKTRDKNKKIDDSNLKWNNDLTYDSIVEKLCQQGGKCIVTGIDLTIVSKTKRSMYNLSIDRIDSNIGYINSNIVLVTLWANVTKSDISMTVFVSRIYEARMSIEFSLVLSKVITSDIIVIAFSYI
jgi:hypothetical protein